MGTKKIEDKYSELGQKSYHPKIMLKLLFYGYATGIRSGRKIAKACETDCAFMYLSQMYKPDFRTINDFRKNNQEIIEEYFVDIVRMCQKLGMVRVGTISIDSCKIRANASAKRTKNKEEYEKWLKNIEGKIKEILREAQQIDEEEDKKFMVDKRGDEIPKHLHKKEVLKEKVKEIMKELKDEKEKINLTDRDAKFIKERCGVIRPNYNCHVAAGEDQIIVAAEVVNIASDQEHLIQMVEEVEKNVKEKIEKVCADSGYASLHNYEELEKRKIDTYIPDRNYQAKERGRGPEVSMFHKNNFVYDKNGDYYICPTGMILRLVENKLGDNSEKISVYRCMECKECEYFGICTTSSKGRSIERSEYDEPHQKMREKLSTPEGKEIYKKRKTIVEPVFGNISQNLGFKEFMLRTLKKVKAEFVLICSVHNLLKIARFLRRIKSGVGEVYLNYGKYQIRGVEAG